MLVIITIHLHLPGCTSLKEKRGRLKPFIARLQHEFNVSVAEMDLQDSWQQSVIGCAMIAGNRAFLDAAAQNILRWVEAHWTEGDVIDRQVEFIT